MTHICVSYLTIISPDNGWSPGRRQAIIWTNAGLMLIGPLGINFCEILIEVHTFSFMKMHLKMSSAKWGSISSRPQCVNIRITARCQCVADYCHKRAWNVLVANLQQSPYNFVIITRKPWMSHTWRITMVTLCTICYFLLVFYVCMLAAHVFCQ